MASKSLVKTRSPGALLLKYLDKKFDAVRYLPKLANAVLMFNSAGALVATDQPLFKYPVSSYTANGAIALTSGVHAIAKTSAAAMTVAAPTAAQDGMELIITANTNFAHVITFTGATLLNGATGAKTTVTLTAFIGSTIVVVAVGTKWLLKSSSNITSVA